MTIGELNRRITLMKFVVERDAYGGEDGEWVDVCRLWAKIEPSSGTEFMQAQQVQAEHITKITLRYNPKIDVMHRIKYADKTYEIIAVGDFTTSHRWTVITAKEMVSDGLQCKAEKGESGGGRSECPCEGTEIDGGCCIICTDEGC